MRNVRGYLAYKVLLAEREETRKREAVEYYGYRIAVVFFGLMMGVGLPIVWLLTK